MHCLVDLPIEDSELPKLPFNFTKTDSSNRILDFPISSRGNSAFTLLNPADELGISRIWNSHGFNTSRPPTIQAIQTESKFSLLQQQDMEERKDDGEIERSKNGMASSIEHLVAQEYFSNTGMFNANHNTTTDKKN